VPAATPPIRLSHALPILTFQGETRPDHISGSADSACFLVFFGIALGKIGQNHVSLSPCNCFMCKLLVFGSNISMTEHGILLSLYPAESRVIIFDFSNEGYIQTRPFIARDSLTIFCLLLLLSSKRALLCSHRPASREPGFAPSVPRAAVFHL
jgi:hypothetical protein